MKDVWYYWGEWLVSRHERRMGTVIHQWIIIRGNIAILQPLTHTDTFIITLWSSCCRHWTSKILFASPRLAFCLCEEQSVLCIPLITLYSRILTHVPTGDKYNIKHLEIFSSFLCFRVCLISLNFLQWLGAIIWRIK